MHKTIGVIITFLIFVTHSQQKYVIPDVIITPINPTGLRIQLPDSDGVQAFGFYANVNEPINGKEYGTIARKANAAENGYWTVEDSNIQLNAGDTIHYWFFVQHNRLGFDKKPQQFLVTDLIDASKIGSASCGPSETRRNDGNTTCAGELIFEENFDDNVLDEGKWIREQYIARDPDYEFVTYINSPDNVDTRGGNLYIKPTLATDKFGENFLKDKINLGPNCTGIPRTSECDRIAEGFLILPPIFSGKITTRKKFTFVYGKVEIRAKLPKGDWVYPELFLNPKSPEYGFEYDSGQIRIAFSPGNEQLGKELTGGVVLSTSPEGRSQMMRSVTNKLKRWSDDFHIYIIEWRKDSITCSVDGMAYGNIYAPSGDFSNIATQIKSDAGDRWHAGGTFAPFNKEMYLTIGVGVGGHNFPDNVIGGKPWKNLSPKNMLTFWKDKNNWINTWNADSALVVDYVRVWAL